MFLEIYQFVHSILNLQKLVETFLSNVVKFNTSSINQGSTNLFNPLVPGTH